MIERPLLTDTPISWTATVYSRQSSTLHDRLCDAFLFWGGYVILDDALFEITHMDPVPEAGMFRWYLRAVRHAGLA